MEGDFNRVETRECGAGARIDGAVRALPIVRWRNTGARRLQRLFAVILILVPLATATPPARSTPPDFMSDTLYNAVHPTLLFHTPDVPALYAKVRDGGIDDLAYLFIRNRVDNVYAYLPTADLLENDYGLEQTMNLALATFLEAPYDTTARNMGKALTLYIADNFDVDDDCYASSLRLRNLALGYDMFFAGATVAERTRVRDEVSSYLVHILTSLSYDVWHHRPYVSNKTAMLSSALGLAAIGLHYELDPAQSGAALSAADTYFRDWLDSHLEPGGAYREGLLYGLWSMRNLVYYFVARLLYDGYDYSLEPGVRQMEQWLAYELDPRGQGHVNNIQDCTDFFRPLARHNTYMDWAEYKWGSELSAYIFLHGPGGFGVDMGDNADKAATALWSQPLFAADPDASLPHSRLWTDRGLYYFRTGWPVLFNSNDVVFSFYSGVFHGGHAQEDQNQFTLTAYGSRLVSDNGAGTIAKESEAHNVILIDGAGQHNAGYSIGTDGAITSYLLGDYMDYLVGDATAAYTTYSPYNENDYPYPGTDWSWGHKGANPVLYAHRKVVTVHDAEAPPYFLVVDDIDKDGLPHSYEWRMHTDESNTVDASANPVHVSGSGAAMEVLVVNPCIDSLAVGVSYFDNGAEDPNSNVLSLTTTATNPRFATLLLPRAAATPATPTSTSRLAGGTLVTLDLGGGYQDLVYIAGTDSCGQPDPLSTSLVTDADVAVVRLHNAVIVRYLMATGTTLWYAGIERARVDDGAAGVSRSDQFIYIDRLDADFVVYAPEDLRVFFHDIPVPTTRQGDYLYSAATNAVPQPAAGMAMSLRAFPNPFNPGVHVVVSMPEAAPATVDVYDVGGRRVARLWNGALSAGETRLEWRAGAGVASGVYFLRVETPTATRSVKLTVLK